MQSKQDESRKPIKLTAMLFQVFTPYHVSILSLNQRLRNQQYIWAWCSLSKDRNACKNMKVKWKYSPHKFMTHHHLTHKTSVTPIFTIQLIFFTVTRESPFALIELWSLVRIKLQQISWVITAIVHNTIFYLTIKIRCLLL